MKRAAQHATKVKVILYSYVGHHEGSRVVRARGHLNQAICREKRMFVWVGPPTTPDYNWVCNTGLVWPVLKVDGQDIELLEAPYLCRHMIEAGD